MQKIKLGLEINIFEFILHRCLPKMSSITHLVWKEKVGAGEGQRDSWVVPVQCGEAEPRSPQERELGRNPDFSSSSITVIPAQSCRQKQYCLWSELPVGFAEWIVCCPSQSLPIHVYRDVTRKTADTRGGLWMQR